jgi:hypothetical protein
LNDKSKEKESEEYSTHTNSELKIDPRNPHGRKSTGATISNETLKNRE